MEHGWEKKKRSLAGLLTGGLAALAFLLVLLRSDVAIEYMKRGLKLCAHTVIPSLFPFMVISELIVAGGLGQKVGRLLAWPMKRLFGVSENGACAFLLGAICGFPIGARTLCAMQDRGLISRREFSRALTFCNNPGSAFVISAVGVSLFGSKQLGGLLYVCVLLSAVVVGAFGRLFFGRGGEEREKKSPMLPSPSPSRQSGILAFTEAIRNSALSMLTVCAYVAFFSSLVGCLGAMLAERALPATLVALIFGFFELSGGVGMAAECGGAIPTVLLCAAICGWSGLSVHFQIMTLCAGRGISFKPYWIAKAAQGVVCALLTGIALKLFPLSEETFAGIGQVARAENGYRNAGFVCAVFSLAAICPIVVSALKNRGKSDAKKFFKNFSKRG